MSGFAVTPSARRVVLALAMFTLASWAMLLGALIAWPAAPSRAATAIARLARAAGATLEAPAPAADFACVDEHGGGTSSYEYGFETGEEEFSWALLDEDGNSTGENMSSRRVRSGARDGEPRFWFIDRGDEFVVSDRAIIEEVRAATRELRELGAQMGALGSEMGRKGARMGRIGGRMGAIGARMGAVQAQLGARSASRTARADIAARMNELRVEMELLRSQMDAERANHDRGHEALSRRMSELSARHHEALRAARAKVREIAGRARREGKAERPHANA